MTEILWIGENHIDSLETVFARWTLRSVNAPRVLSPLRAVEARTTLAIRRGEPLLRAGFTSSTLGAILEGVIF